MTDLDGLGLNGSCVGLNSTTESLQWSAVTKINPRSFSNEDYLARLR